MRLMVENPVIELRIELDTSTYHLVVTADTVADAADQVVNHVRDLFDGATVKIESRSFEMQVTNWEMYDNGGIWVYDDGFTCDHCGEARSYDDYSQCSDCLYGDCCPGTTWCGCADDRCSECCSDHCEECGCSEPDHNPEATLAVERSVAEEKYGVLGRLTTGGKA